MDHAPTSIDGTLYLWRIRKRGHRAHVENPRTGQAYCQAENCSGGKPFDGRGEEAPTGRPVCKNCAELLGRNKTDYREPDILVLMGERLAETEPELFATTAAPKPWTQNRPKKHKPKRSNAKCAKPFNDSLPPWL